MKKSYLLYLGCFTLLSIGTFAQQSSKYNSDDAFQKTLVFEKNVPVNLGMKRFGELYGLNADNSFVLKYRNSDKTGVSHEKFEQFYKGIKITFGTVIVHSNNGNIESINGELYNAQKLNLTPTLTPQQGFDRVTTFMNAQKYMWEDIESARALNYNKPSGELVIFPIVNTGEVRLAYKYDIYAIQPLSRDDIFVDAHSGEILFRNPTIKHAENVVSSPDMEKRRAQVAEAILLGQNKEEVLSIATPLAASSAATRYSGTKTIQTDMSGANYILSEAARTSNGITGSGAHTYNSANTATYPTTDFTNTSTNWSTGNYATGHSSKDNAALDAHWGAEMVYDWWATVFNRNSFDNAGAQIKSYVHYNLVAAGQPSNDNAFWNGSVMTYGDGSTFNVLTSIDICGHEIGHAVCSYTADLAYQNHSGAMNEGLSDIWGACIEWWGRNSGSFAMPTDGASPGTQAAWKIGEDVTSGGLRSMSWPRSKGNPDTYKGTSWTTTANDGVCTPAAGNDYCGVHNNSGVLNHWFYLLTIGKTSWTNNATPTRTTTTTGIGMQKAAQITYLAERDYLTPNATYSDMRNATISVAKSLYGCGSAEHIAVMNSWYAVNIGMRYTDLDLKIGTITGDSNVACGASHSFSFTLENASSTSVNSATTTYTIDGGAAVAVPWTGPALTACGTASQNYTISLGALSRGTHTIVVTTTATGDTDTTNNSRTAYVTVNDAGTVGTINPFTATTDALVSIDKGGMLNSVWQRGTVNKTPLTAAATGNSAGYATKLVGNYPDATTSYLVSQCYNLSTYSNTSVSFDMAFDLESNWDILYFEYSTDNGASWNVLGTMSDPTWYNSSRLPDGTDCFNCIGKQWTGDYATAPTGGNGMNGNRRNYSHSLTSLGNPASAIFRFTFVSDESANQKGVFIDNFVVSGTLGTNNFSFEQFGVYPNPSKGKFNVVLSTTEKVKMELFDIRGRSVFAKQYDANGSIFNQEVDLSNLSNGVYILNVESAGKKEAKRIIIE